MPIPPMRVKSTANGIVFPSRGAEPPVDGTPTGGAPVAVGVPVLTVGDAGTVVAVPVTTVEVGSTVSVAAGVDDEVGVGVPVSTVDVAVPGTVVSVVTGVDVPRSTVTEAIGDPTVDVGVLKSEVAVGVAESELLQAIDAPATHAVNINTPNSLFFTGLEASTCDMSFSMISYLLIQSKNSVTPPL